jgi:3-dehydroquinate dehydratase-1
MLTLGSVILGERPCLVAAVRDGVPRAAVDEALAAGLSAVELRVDLFSSLDPASVGAEARRYQGVPLIGTIRLAAEGGAWNRTEPERAALYAELLPHVAAIDIEVSALPGLQDTVQSARKAGRLVIGSFHDFASTPSREQLAATAESALGHGADLVKTACFCRDPEDVRTLAQFLLDDSAPHKVVIAMGSAGLLSRVFFPALGSLLTYTYLGEATAPGQLTCPETLRYLGAFYPKSARPA